MAGSMGEVVIPDDETVCVPVGPSQVVTMSTEESLTVVAMTEGDGTEAADGGAAEDEEEEDEDVPPVKDEEEEEFEKGGWAGCCLTPQISMSLTGVLVVAVPVVIVPPELEGTELAEATKQLNEKVKAKQQRRLDKLKQDVADTIRYHEAGWKERYYADKFKVRIWTSASGLLTFRTMRFVELSWLGSLCGCAWPPAEAEHGGGRRRGAHVPQVHRGPVLGLRVLLPRLPVVGVVLPLPLRALRQRPRQHREVRTRPRACV